MTRVEEDLTGTTIAVVGSGYMGGGIAQVFAAAGARVAIADVTAEIAATNRERLVAEAYRFVADGLFPDGFETRVEENLHAAESIEVAVAEADLIEEAVPEKLEIKHSTLERISRSARADAIIGSNTSSIAIGTLATVVEAPERFLGIHFMNPAPFVPGVEIIVHETTSESVAQRALDIVARAGKAPGIVKDVTGFVVNRIQYAALAEAARLVEEGVADAATIDTLVRSSFGFRLPIFGPFQVADIAGLDVYADTYAQLEATYGERFATPVALRSLVEQGRFGLKTGAGFADFTEDDAKRVARHRDRSYAALQALVRDLDLGQ